jgi:hypothetical protein
MTQSYRTFEIHGGAEPMPKTLLGRTTLWSAAGRIAYIRPDRSVVEITRFRLPGMKFDDEAVARWFGVELARLVVDWCYRELVIERYETEKRRIQRGRRGR